MKIKLKNKFFVTLFLCLIFCMALIPLSTTTAFAAGEHTHCVCGDPSCEKEVDDGHQQVEYLPLSSYLEDPAREEEEIHIIQGNYYLDKDFKLSKTLYINGYLNLCLNGNVLEGNGESLVIHNTSKNATFNLCDCAKTTTHKFRVEENKPWTLDNTDGSQTVNGGVITGGKNNRSGGAICIENGSTMNMYGGSIVGNITGESGGGVYFANSGGIFNMYDGKISNNIANYGGGVYTSMFNSDSTFNMYGGIISDNIANGKGGGVNLYIANIYDGEITGNNAANGGGVYISSRLYMHGGSITQNTATPTPEVYMPAVVFTFPVMLQYPEIQKTVCQTMFILI